MNFTVIDFETANRYWNSACALGISVIKGGNIVEKQSWLIKPSKNWFEPINIRIHGIRPEDVQDKPFFAELYKNTFKNFLENQLIVAHNASFDIGVLKHVMNQYNIPYPKLNFLCTLKLAQQHWTHLPNHKLKTLSDYLDFNFNHHDALEDTLASANILLTIGSELGLTSAQSIAKKIGVKIGTLSPDRYYKCGVIKSKKYKKQKSNG